MTKVTHYEDVSKRLPALSKRHCEYPYIYSENITKAHIRANSNEQLDINLFFNNKLPQDSLKTGYQKLFSINFY